MSIVEKIKSYNFKEGEYFICGSAILEVLGIRTSGDIDILVSPSYFEELKKEGWVCNHKYPSTIDSPDGCVGAKQTLDFMKENYTLADIIGSAYWYEGIPFMGLELLVEAKTQLGREKDLVDIVLIKNYLAQNSDK